MNYIHTDYFNFLFKTNFFNSKKINLKNGLSLMEKELLKLGSKKIIIPTYNYDFVKKKIFNIKKDKSQSGSFTEYFRKKYSYNRTSIPIYSSCTNYKIRNLQKEKKIIDVLGKDSDFNYLMNNNGNIIHFECNFGSTFMIFIEKLNFKKIIYRYTKKINGVFLDGNTKKNISIDLFVRPRKLNISYDLNKVKKDLFESKILKQKKIGIFNYYIYNSNKFFEFCNYKLSKDNLYFLDKKSKNELKKNNISFKNKEKIKKFD
jgi:aminoglycoside N3'-acetyltransferase